MDSADTSLQQTSSSANTSARALALHTARKRSKASLLNISGSDEVSVTVNDSGVARSSSGTSLVQAQQQQQHAAMSIDARGRTPLVLQGGNGGGSRGGGRAGAWQIGGWPVDYVLDWGVVLVAVIVLAASEAAQPRAGYVNKTSLRDSSYPLLPNSVPAWAVPVYSLVLPALLLVLHSVVLRRPLLEGHHLVLGLVTAVIVTAAVTNLIKVPVGRLRPDFNARCWPDGKVVLEREDEYGGYPLCTGQAASIAEGRKSFPSGHTSWSAAGMCYLTWWLADRLHPFDGGGHSWRLLAAMLPTSGAVAVGISRYFDYWHHPSDIVAGLLLGSVISWLCYWQQRSRLAEIDPAAYGSGMLGTGAAEAWYAPGAGRAGAEDGTPLLYASAAGQQQQQQQLDRTGLLPV